MDKQFSVGISGEGY